LWFSGFFDHLRWLAILLALRHPGLGQYPCREAFLGSGMNNSLQYLHFFFFVPMIQLLSWGNKTERNAYCTNGLLKSIVKKTEENLL